MEVGDDWVLCYPEFPNITCWIPPSTTKTWFNDIAMYSTSALTAILNLFIIISVSHFRQLHTPTNILLLSLAVSDFLVGLLLLPLHTQQTSSCWFFGALMCCLYRFVSDIIFFASVVNMVLISVDRYVAICDPLHYTTKITVNRVKFCVCLLWLCSVAYNSIYAILHTYQQLYNVHCYGKCLPLINTTAAYVDLALHFFVPVTVIVVLYTRVFVVAVSQARAMRSHITAVTKQISVTKTAKKSELKAARTLGVLVVVFLMCLLPTYFESLVWTKPDNRSTNLIATYLHFFNSFLNPLIYALFYSWFRKAVKLIVTLQILQPGSCEANIL